MLQPLHSGPPSRAAPPTKNIPFKLILTSYWHTLAQRLLDDHGVGVIGVGRPLVNLVQLGLLLGGLPGVDSGLRGGGKGVAPVVELDRRRPLLFRVWGLGVRVWSGRCSGTIVVVASETLLSSPPSPPSLSPSLPPNTPFPLPATLVSVDSHALSRTPASTRAPASTLHSTSNHELNSTQVHLPLTPFPHAPRHLRSPSPRTSHSYVMFPGGFRLLSLTGDFEFVVFWDCFLSSCIWEF